MIADAVGQSLPVAVGVMVSPLPVVAVVLMLVSGRARANATAFVVTWFVTVGAVAALVALLAGSATGDGGEAAARTGWLKIALGVLLLVLAVRQWQGRPRAGVEPEVPGWMAAVDTFTPVRAAALAALLGGVNPKNLLLAVSGGAAIGSAAAGDVGVVVGGALVFAAVATVGVAAPVVVYLTAGDRAAQVLEDLRAWMVEHNAVVMSVLLLVLAAKLVGDGLSVV